MAKQGQGTITASQIASSVGCSRATVYRSLNNDKGVKPATVKRVQELAQQFNYMPQASARAMSAGRTHMIGVVFPMYREDLAYRFKAYATALDGIRTGLAKKDYVLTLAEWLESASEGKLPDHRISRILREVFVEGILMMQTPPGPELEQVIRSQGLPYVAFDAVPAPGRITVMTNEVRAAELAVEHLVELGHHRIAYIALDAGPPLAHAFTCPRHEGFPRGYAQAMSRADLKLMPGWDERLEIGEDLERLWKSPDPPTALICYDDQSCVFAGNWLDQRGLAVPKDVSLVALLDTGFAETCNGHAHFMPRLTCKVEMHRAMADVAVELIHNLVESDEDAAADSVVLEPTLVVRDSSGPCRQVH